MAVEVLVPKLGMTMTEGTVAEWLVADGAKVEAGAPVYRLETEKIEFQVDAETAGIVRHLVPAGTKLEPGAVAGYILAPGEAMPAGPAGAPPAPVAASTAAGAAAAAPVAAAAVRGDGRVAASPAARRLAGEAGIDLATVAGTGPGGRITEEDVLAAKARPVPAAAPSPAAGEVIASPVARRLAETLGVDLGKVAGSGPGGRITKEDVEAAAAAGATVAPAPAAAGAPPATAPARRAGDVIPMRAMRKTIAERMHGSLQQMAQLTMGMEAGMDAAVGLRTRLVKDWEADGIRPTYTDLIIKAVATALSAHPLLNAAVTEAGIELLPEIHVGMAVALDDGLVVPVIRNADQLTLRQIAVESSRLATAARAKTLGMDEMAGGTFSVTSLGMADIDFFTPIINPPNVAILGVGRIRDDVAWDGSTPRRTKRMTLSLTIDHRAVDGAPGAAFLGTVRDLLQAPFRLLS